MINISCSLSYLPLLQPTPHTRMFMIGWQCSGVWSRGSSRVRVSFFRTSIISRPCRPMRRCYLNENRLYLGAFSADLWPHLSPRTRPLSLLRAAAVRQLLDDVTDRKAAATGRQVLLLHLQPAQRTHRKALADRQVNTRGQGAVGWLNKSGTQRDRHRE